MRSPATLFAASIMTALVTLSPAHAQNGPNAFTFIGWGDAPYVLPGDYAKVDRLIAAMNNAKPAFSIHVGDTKAGGTPCTDEILKKAFDQIQTAEHPVVYSIGDNEWTDCHRKNAGGFDPRERLAKVRQMYFPAPGMSLGRNPMKLESQSRLEPRFANFVENQRFVRNGVVFVIPHVVGSNNGLETGDKKAAEEFFERDAANIAWIEAGFDLAVDVDAKAIVIAFQANLYDTRRSAGTSIPPSSGFYNTLRAISRRTRVRQAYPRHAWRSAFARARGLPRSPVEARAERAALAALGRAQGARHAGDRRPRHAGRVQLRAADRAGERGVLADASRTRWHLLRASQVKRAACCRDRGTHETRR
jgi:hypothetical protein